VPYEHLTGPIRAVNEVTGEVRGWLVGARGVRWLEENDDLDAWDIMDDKGNAAWKLGPKMLPDEDGRVRGHIEYETPDQRRIRLACRGHVE
jgi:hypothetical protein